MDPSNSFLWKYFSLGIRSHKYFVKPGYFKGTKHVEQKSELKGLHARTQSMLA